MNRSILAASLSLILSLLACSASDGSDDSTDTSTDDLHKSCAAYRSGMACNEAYDCIWSSSRSRCEFYDRTGSRGDEPEPPTEGGEPTNGPRSWSCTYDWTMSGSHLAAVMTREEALVTTTRFCESKFDECDTSLEACLLNPPRGDGWRCWYSGTNYGATSSPTAFTLPEAIARAAKECRDGHPGASCTNVSCR